MNIHFKIKMRYKIQDDTNAIQIAFINVLKAVCLCICVLDNIGK